MMHLLVNLVLVGAIPGAAVVASCTPILLAGRRDRRRQAAHQRGD